MMHQGSSTVSTFREKEGKPGGGDFAWLHICPFADNEKVKMDQSGYCRVVENPHIHADLDVNVWYPLPSSAYSSVCLYFSFYILLPKCTH